MKKHLTFGKQFFRLLSALNGSLICLVLLIGIPANVQAQCDGGTVLSITGTVNGASSTWTAPATGGPFTVTISATGAGGGDVIGINGLGGSGATMSGTFTVQNGQTIRAIAGWRGDDGDGLGAGGGGGSGAVNVSTATILIIAAGGNGDNGPAGAGLGGSADEGGNGQGGASGGADSGGGGGGEATNGANSTGFGGGFGGAKVILTGFSVGGQGSNSGGGDGGNGMGGGGGGGNEGTGGGGGHTGGDGANTTAAKSFNSGGDGTDGATGGGANLGQVTIVCEAAAPVELMNFAALVQQSGGVQLLWSTATEKNNLGFELERSADNRNWSMLGFMPGNGTTASRHDYHFMDESPIAGINYYRLKQLDTDGKYEYSPMVVADIHTNGPRFDVFPNPSTTGELSIRAVSNQEGDALLEIYSWAGYKVYHETLRVYKGTIAWPLDMTTFPKGTYTARLEMPDGTVQFKKVLIQ